MTDKAKFLKEKGWFNYYHKDHWCHSQFSPNCENYGFTLDSAYEFENDEDFKKRALEAIDLKKAAAYAWNAIHYKF